MRLIVDRDRCEGHGVCEGAAPDLLKLDEHGDLVLLADGELPPDLRQQAADSVLICPVAALKLEG
ncbi:ferredoxin [Actinosynnema sp. NPDC047251]|uniref:Putative ferrodoxin protein n=1 Tax=Saccharothrix espanaensis (strain ATCC 51144 / DSM 44229 / JCM 9112 / NBRC 15066 / NRRL 15764) TaxID=1179773 RepID=K0K7V5_SACES|nr:ferredoxin [Saccharothrix espanaensis]CCH32733.1 putative ferrodoxin protein [Saccharothrix espanaensis DSM 44229]